MNKPELVYFLLVDDLAENLLSLEALLRREGLVLLKARSGTEALELLLQHEVALALLDVQMPGMDGFELAELMRGTERTRRIPIIFLTAGSADRSRRFRGYEAGAVDFIYKPIEPDVLKSKTSVFFDLHRQQQELQRQRDQLQEKSEENARLLAESLEYASALRDADRRKDEFLATLAHELRNPLAPIRNGLQILRMSKDEEMSANVREMMDRQLSHLVRLIDDLLDVSRISQGKIVLRRGLISIQAAVDSAVESSRTLIDGGRHRLVLDVVPEPIWIEADPIRISQIITNLLNNAAKYTPEGGEIRVSVREDNGGARVTVADNGIGISAEMLPRIFELFTQVDYKMEQSQGGLGIGLALVRKLVALHGGTATADSEGLGKGSSFSVWLPLAAQKPAALAADDAAKEGAVARELNFLIVDDNVASAQSTGLMLEMMGHKAALAHDGNAAITQAEGLNPDVVMLDIGLPGKNGYEVCRELRQKPGFANVTFIAQTGWGQDTDKKQAFDAGFDHHIVKPISFQEFSTLLHEIQLKKPA
ncbi:MAG TPA: response regulator [Patescibacteria group bacterium]|nr:response regulator [Patescibacteria group bacterium]